MNKKSPEIFDFGQYLEMLLIRQGKKIKTHDYSFILHHAHPLKELYYEIIGYIQNTIMKGNIFELEHYIEEKVNGSFLRRIKSFLYDYEHTY
jgi:hypothetical protein